MQIFEFHTITVDHRGKVIKREQKEAKYLVEDLGKGVTLEMVQIPGGSFMMGSKETEEGKGRFDGESPQHQVTVPNLFMGKYPVTQAQYQAIMGNNPALFQGIFKSKNRPVESVSWNDAMEFCQKLSQKTGKNYRFPSEAEWEYACRAGTTTPFYFGETITANLANYSGNYTYASSPKGVFRQETTQVGKFPANAFGLYDMHGNVWELCQDSWHDSYNHAPTDGSAWIDENNQYRVVRGGSWGDAPSYCRSAVRSINSLDDRFTFNGFRLVFLG
jgi:eukaryotic-like serine/threonine-protein kinase